MVLPRIRLTRVLLLLVAIAGCDTGEEDGGDSNIVSPPSPPASAAAENDYRDWGWEALVLRNGYVTLAVVPAIGGRIMEFSLGSPESNQILSDLIWRNPQRLGQTPAPSPSAWPNHGGYKNWPAPQDRWNWPPPPTLDYGPYEAEISLQSGDSVTISLGSPVEQFRTPGLRFERRITLYAGSSRVRVEQTLSNAGPSPANWSIWDITQHVASHGSALDYDNFRVYFPINSQSRYGTSGVRTDGASAAWAGHVSPGVYEVVFRPDNKKLFADSRGGWICFADIRDGYAYAKTFPIFNEAEYPDQGADVEVYVSNQGYVEVEVLSPLVNIVPDAGYTFTEEWWIARTDGPVVGVNHVGLVNEPLVVRRAGGELSGTFGVFHAGHAYVAFLNAGGTEVGRSAEAIVRPDQLLRMTETATIPAAAVRAALTVENADGREVGVLSLAEIAE